MVEFEGWSGTIRLCSADANDTDEDKSEEGSDRELEEAGHLSDKDRQLDEDEVKDEKNEI